MRRRRILATIATAAAPALAGCSPCGETWTGVGWTVSPTDLRSTRDGWAVDVAVDVSFSFGRDGHGVYRSTVAAFDDDGRILGRERLGTLRWDDVPADARTETDCGDHGTLTRRATVEASEFPRWVGLRYGSASDSYGDPRLAARYDGTPTGRVTPDGYRSVDVTDGATREGATPSGDVAGVRFTRQRPACEAYPTADVSTRAGLAVRWVRRLPAQRYHAVLADVAVSGQRLRLDVGLRAWPRFHALSCLREGYTARIDVDGDLPDVVELRHRAPDGTVTERSVVRRVPRGTTSETGTGTWTSAGQSPNGSAPN